MITLIVSPYRAPEHPCYFRLHDAYLDCAIRDAVIRGYTPVATHKMYTDSLDDNDPVQRVLGMQQREVLLSVAEHVLVYSDLGTSAGMQEDIDAAKRRGVSVEYVYLYPKEKPNAPRSP